MKKIFLIIFIVNLYSFSFCQSVDIFGMNLNSNANMYSHTYGYGISYNKNIKDNKVGIQLSQSWFTKEYDDIYRSMTSGQIVTEEIKPKNQRICLKGSYGFNILNKPTSKIFIGTELSLNYFFINEVFYSGDPITDTKYQRDKIKKNRIGCGLFLEYEINEIITKNLSVFMTTNIERTNFHEYGIMDDCKYPMGISWIGINLGIRYHLTKNE